MQGTIGVPLTVQLGPRVVRARLKGMMFDVDKTFLRPESMAGIRGLVRLFDKFKSSSVLIVGHASATGQEAHNQKLSEERALSIQAFLMNDVEFWLQFYDGRSGSVKWGAAEDNMMLQSLGFSAVKPYQQSKGLDDDGIAGTNTRRALVGDYMAQDGTSLPLTTNTQTHGCGEFHLLIQDQGENPENRRTEFFLFDGAIDPAPRSPCNNCPQYKSWDTATVQTVNIDLRLQTGHIRVTVKTLSGAQEPIEGAKVRIFEGVPDEGLTDASGAFRFADVFSGNYQVVVEAPGFVTSAPRDVAVPPGTEVTVPFLLQAQWQLRLLRAGNGPPLSHAPFADKPFSVTGTGDPSGTFKGATDKDGIARFPVIAETNLMKLTIDGKEFELAAGSLPALTAAGDPPVDNRLRNLGYGKAVLPWDAATRTAARAKFNSDHGLSNPSENDFRAKLREIYGG